MSAKRLEQVALATKTAFVFPGQGSQKVGMLAELAEQFSGVGQTFAEALEQTAIELPTIPVIQNVNAGIANDVAQLRQALTAQLYQSVQWTRTMQSLQDQGIQYIVECGPGTVLSNLAKRLPNIEKAFSIDSKSKMEDALNAVLVAEGKIA